MAKKATPNFEASLAELESIVLTLEAGNTPLDAALAAYQQGATVLRECQDALSVAEQRIQILEQGLLRDIPLQSAAHSGDDE